MTRNALVSGARSTVTASEEARAAGAAYSSGRPQPAVESRTPVAARRTAHRIPMLIPLSPLEPLRPPRPPAGCVVGRGAPRQPFPERFRFPREAPLLEDRLGHRSHAAVPLSRGVALRAQPRPEFIPVRVGGNPPLPNAPPWGGP